ncbi:MAG: quinone-dependent dihydroorotate dehydrogenase [bacterium]|nr:quinone-dependent dihydroorotate dehydrogenase [bacterium]
MPAIDWFYQYLAKPVFFQFDPERVHEFVMRGLGFTRPFKPLIASCLRVEDARLHQTIHGVKFDNPIGLAGGFDKNALAADLWPMFGFGFFEIGTVTPLPQPGNPKPRLFRYPGRDAIVNRMGFNNDGADAIASRLAALSSKQTLRGVMGVSLGKQFSTPVDDLDAVIGDYRSSLARLYEYGDYFAVNVSSPNTKNLRALQEKGSLANLLSALKTDLDERAKTGPAKPFYVKLAPDLSDVQITEAVETALGAGVDGFIATNTTNQTGVEETGGLSGRPLRERSTQAIALIANVTEKRVPIMGAGGIFDAADGVEKLDAGAWLLQLYTGFIYQGPGVVRAILKGMLEEMDKRGYQSIQDFRKK